MTIPIFENLIQNFNSEMQKQNRKVILLVDNACVHKLSVELLKDLTYVKIPYMPPKSTSVLQPLDQGIIHSFKCINIDLNVPTSAESTDREIVDMVKKS